MIFVPASELTVADLACLGRRGESRKGDEAGGQRRQGTDRGPAAQEEDHEAGAYLRVPIPVVP